MVSVFHFILFSCIFSQYYDLNINQTGQSHLVVLQESINLEENWEIGIFDQSAIVTIIAAMMNMVSCWSLQESGIRLN